MPLEYNKGNISEAVLAAAIGARFKKRFQQPDFKKSSESIKIGMLPQIGLNDVKLVLRDIVRNQGSSYTVYDFDRKEKKIANITDNINLNISIPARDFEFLRLESNWSKISEIFSSALNKINSDGKIKSQAYGLAVNKKYDTINIVAQGTQGTKIDIDVSFFSRDPSKKISSALRGSQISLKYDSPQFAQSVGIEFENFGKIFDELGLNDYKQYSELFLNEVMKVYPDILGKRFSDTEQIKSSNEVKALRKVAKVIFGKINSELNVKLKTPEFKSVLAQYCINKSISNQSGVELVQFTKKGTSVTQSFKPTFTENLINSDLKSTFIDSIADPKVIIHLSGKSSTKPDMLIQFRYRTDASQKNKAGFHRLVMRTYVESGDLIYEL